MNNWYVIRVVGAYGKVFYDAVECNEPLNPETDNIEYEDGGLVEARWYEVVSAGITEQEATAFIDTMDALATSSIGKVSE